MLLVKITWKLVQREHRAKCEQFTDDLHQNQSPRINRVCGGQTEIKTKHARNFTEILK